MSNKYTCVMFLVSLSSRLGLSFEPDYTTISPSEAAAEYNRKIKLIEENQNFSYSEADISINSVSSLNDILKDPAGGFAGIITTTIDPRFVTGIRLPLGYHRQVLLNKTMVTGDRQKRKVALTGEVTNLKTLRTTTKWTPYPDYDTEYEKSLQRKCPPRINLINRARQKHLERMESNISYSEESVPSSCECHAGNWSESYDMWEKWKQKQCKPMFLNYQYGMNLEGTEFRKGHEPAWYKKRKKEEIGNAKSSLEKSRHVPKSVRQRGQNYYPRHAEYFENEAPMYAPPYARYSQRLPQRDLNYYPEHVGHPRNEAPVYPPPYVGYPPMYYPHAMQPQMPPHYPSQYNHPHPHQAVIDPVAYRKLEELQREIQELKEKTTVNMWDQYLKLKEKFETTQSRPSPTVSYNERLVSYRKLEKKEPFYSKFQPNVMPMRPSNTHNTYQSARIQFNEQYQRTIHNRDIYRKNPFLVEDVRINEKETFNNHFLRITQAEIHKNEHNPRAEIRKNEQYPRTEIHKNEQYPRAQIHKNEQNPRAEIHKNEQYNRFDTARAVHISNSSPKQQTVPIDRRVYSFRVTKYPTRVYQRDTQTVAWTRLTRESFQQKGNQQSPRVAEQHIQDARWKIQTNGSNPHGVNKKPNVAATKTLPPVSLSQPTGGETTTEDLMAVYKRYRDQYEFPDYVAEKRRLMRAKQKEAKRKLYAARGLVYDEEPPRITTRPTTTGISEFYFKDRMEYLKYMFDDKSLPIDTSPHTVFNNAPTFDVDHEEGQKAYLKWLLSDKSLEIDPMS